MNIYNFNINTFIKRILGAKLRNSKSHFFWIKSLLKPVDYLKSQLLIFKNQTDIELSYTNQTINIERMLNDKFDPAERRIKVQHKANNNEYYFLSSEGQVYDHYYLISEGIQPQFYFRLGENTTLIDTYDFIVLIPSSLNDEIPQITANVNKIKLASKKFNVQ